MECFSRLLGMRGDDKQLQSGMFSYVPLEQRVPPDHPLRAIRKLMAAMATQADGTAEPDAALLMVSDLTKMGQRRPCGAEQPQPAERD